MELLRKYRIIYYKITKEVFINITKEKYIIGIKKTNIPGSNHIIKSEKVEKKKC